MDILAKNHRGLGTLAFISAELQFHFYPSGFVSEENNSLSSCEVHHKLHQTDQQD